MARSLRIAGAAFIASAGGHLAWVALYSGILPGAPLLAFALAFGAAFALVVWVPAWDFTRDARLHSRMAVMRAVEGGYSIARAAANGLLTGSDYFGRITAERSMLLAALPLGGGKTMYSEYGEWFAWVCVVVALALVAVASSPHPGVRLR
jgi:apolipoprotein N-acyltransferase